MLLQCVFMRLVPVLEMATAQETYLNLEHATLVDAMQLDRKARLLRRDQETWVATFLVTVGGTAKVYATRRLFASQQETLAWIDAVTEVVR